MSWHRCKVVKVCVSADGTETQSPVIYIMLSDQQGAFSDTWFFAANTSKAEMLSMALTAISMDSTVNAVVKKPHAKNSPYTQLSRLELFAPPETKSTEAKLPKTKATVSAKQTERLAVLGGGIIGVFPPGPPDLTVHNLTVTGDIFLTNQPAWVGEPPNAPISPIEE